MDPEVRAAEAKTRLEEVRRDWSIEKSVGQFHDLVEDIRIKKANA